MTDPYHSDMDLSMLDTYFTSTLGVLSVYIKTNEEELNNWITVNSEKNLVFLALN